MKPSEPAVRTGLVHCPNCAVMVGRDQVLCPGCGAVLPIENATARIRALVPAFLATLRQAGTQPLHLFLWVLACVPMLIGPPLVAIAVVALRTWRSHARYRTGTELPVLLLLVAALNIVLSLLAWRYLAHDLWRLVGPAVMEMMNGLGLPGARRPPAGLRVQI